MVNAPCCGTMQVVNRVMVASWMKIEETAEVLVALKSGFQPTVEPTAFQAVVVQLLL